MTTKEITLRKIEPPLEQNLVKELTWLLTCMGIPERFANNYARILIQIAKRGTQGEKISTKTLANEIGEKRTSLLYHINRMVTMGLIVREGRSLHLRASNFERTVEEIERDVLRIFEDMKKVAREVDELLGLPRR